MKILVVGKDARTHCAAKRLHDEGAVVSVVSDFNNPGLKRVAHKFLRENTSNVDAVVNFATEVRPDLVFVGPEEPLEAGLVDRIREGLGTPCVGPTKALARLESSKSFTRQLFSKHKIAGSVDYRVFDPTQDLGAVAKYLRALGSFVIKPDGLTGGKGVKVSGDHLSSIDDGLAYARELFDANKRIVIEEKLEGEEFSLQSFFDGETVVHTFPIQDHKRALDGDAGPNTGGMGSYSCEDHLLPFLSPEHLAAARNINTHVANALREESKAPYRGILYGGFMATADGVRVLEYNARFGDPEAMNVIPLLKTSFVELCTAIAEGALRSAHVELERRATVCKYLVPQGYPDSPVRGDRIHVGFEDTANCRMFYAAVDDGGGQSVVLTGSRALAFVGIADTVSKAAEIAEAAINSIEGRVVHRRDIGTPALLQKRVQHFRQVQENHRPLRMQG